jgi:chromosome segregation ATPase
MHRTLIASLALLVPSTVALAETLPPDSQLTQVMIGEIRQLRSELQLVAATVQRVQIVMYRLQSSTMALDRVTQKFEQARASCNNMQFRRRMLVSQMQQWEEAKRRAPNRETQNIEGAITETKSAMETLTTEEQECQVERGEAENQVRLEQARLSDLQTQLDKLDRVLAGVGFK